MKLLVRDKSVSAHSVTLRETIEAASAKISGATAFEISGFILYNFRFIACNIIDSVI